MQKCQPQNKSLANLIGGGLLLIIYRKGLESGIYLVVEFDDLEAPVVLEFEAIAELDAVAAAVLIDFGDDCAWECGVDIGYDLCGNEGGRNLAGLAFDVTPVAFLIEFHLVAVGVYITL